MLLLTTGALFALACESAETESYDPCDVALLLVKPDSALPGAEAVVAGRPFTSLYDSAIYLDTQRATLTNLERYQCDQCDSCLENYDCNRCSDCDTCDRTCSDCVETISFVIPDIEAGPHALRLFNRHGESNALEFVVEVVPSDTAENPCDSADSVCDTGGPTETGSACDSADSSCDTATDTAEPTDTNKPSDTGKPQDTGGKPGDSGDPDPAKDTASPDIDSGKADGKR